MFININGHWWFGAKPLLYTMSTFNWSNPSSNTVAAIKREFASLGITPPNNANKSELIQILMENKNKSSPRAKGSPGRPGRKPKSPRSPGKQQAQIEKPQSPNVKSEENTYFSSRLLFDDEKPKSPVPVNDPVSPKQETKIDSPKDNSPKLPPKENSSKEASPFGQNNSPQTHKPLRTQSPIQTIEKKQCSSSSFNTEKILLYAMIFAFIFSIIMPSVGPVLLIGCFIAWICVKIMNSKKNQSKQK